MISMDIHRILELLPHRYPFLLIDRVVGFEPMKSIQAVKNVTYNEPYFLGHFPERPIMPGVMILEAMAQATGLLAFHSWGKPKEPGTMYYLVGVDKARFKAPVVPGDQLEISVDWQREIRGIYRFGAEARVAGKLVSAADLMTTKMVVQP